MTILPLLVRLRVPDHLLVKLLLFSLLRLLVVPAPPTWQISGSYQRKGKNIQMSIGSVFPISPHCRANHQGRTIAISSWRLKPSLHCWFFPPSVHEMIMIKSSSKYSPLQAWRRSRTCCLVVGCCSQYPRPSLLLQRAPRTPASTK